MAEGNTEEKILQSAETEFVEKGYDGARMQSIADRAGINKALLHYYYRTKDKLFEVVFRSAAKAFLPKIFKILNDPDKEFETKIREFTVTYIGLIQENPHIPMFIIHELGKKDNRFLKILGEINHDLSGFKRSVQNEIEAGRIKPVEPEQLLMNLVSLCVLPVIAGPIVIQVLFAGDTERYKVALEKRKTEVADFIINALKTEK